MHFQLVGDFLEPFQCHARLASLQTTDVALRDSTVEVGLEHSAMTTHEAQGRCEGFTVHERPTCKSDYMPRLRGSTQTRIFIRKDQLCRLVGRLKTYELPRGEG